MNQNKRNEEEQFIEEVRGMFDNVFFPLWEKNQDVQLEDDEEIVKLARKVYSGYAGETEQSPAAHMFAGFCAALCLVAGGDYEEELVLLDAVLND